MVPFSRKFATTTAKLCLRNIDCEFLQPAFATCTASAGTILGQMTEPKDAKKIGVENAFHEYLLKIDIHLLFKSALYLVIIYDLHSPIIKLINVIAIHLFHKPKNAGYLLYLSSAHSFSFLIAASSSGLKSFTMLNVFLNSSGDLCLIISAIILQPASKRGLMFK